MGRSDVQWGHLQRVLDLVENELERAQTGWAHRGLVERQGLSGLDAMSRRLRRCGAMLPAVARFHVEEACGDPSLCGGRARMALMPGVLVASVRCGVAVLMPVHDSDRNHPMQRTRGHRPVG